MSAITKEDSIRWVEQYGDYLYAFALSRLHNKMLAEDFVQETLLSAFESREKFAENSSVKTWLTAILKHKIFDHYRRTIRQVSFDSEAEETAFFDKTGHWRDSLSDWNLTPEKLFEQKEFQTILQSCLADLPENLAAVFTLREIEGLGTKEICGILSISQNNLWVLLHRARLRLRQAIESRCFGIKTRTEILNHTSEMVFSI